jgi:hypothetical protein
LAVEPLDPDELEVLDEELDDVPDDDVPDDDEPDEDDSLDLEFDLVSDFADVVDLDESDFCSEDDSSRAPEAARLSVR